MFLPTLFINSVVCWSPKMVTTFYTHCKFLRKHLSNNSLLAISWILFYGALKRIMFITTLFINSVVCWSPKMVTTFASHRKVLRRHLSHISVLAISWILFYDALERILLLTIFFINSVVSSSPNLVKILSSLRKFFRWRLSHILLLETSWILFQGALKHNVYYHFIHQQCCLLVTKVGHNVIFASQVFSLTSFWQFASSNFVDSVLRSFEVCNVYCHFIHQQCCLLVTKDGHNLCFASQGFAKTSFSHFCSSNFLNSVLRCSGTYIASYHFFHQ